MNTKVLVLFLFLTVWGTFIWLIEVRPRDEEIQELKQRVSALEIKLKEKEKLCPKSK